jgi:EmrB/QacA subfamily drug resistance transporter
MAQEIQTPPTSRWHIPEPAPLPALTRLAAYPWLVVAITCLAAFAGQIDASIVQLALPALERAFAARLDAVSWVAVAYLLAFSATLPVYARLAEMGGRKLIYFVGFALFTLFSMLCGLAPSLGWLIVFRALQGAAGGMLGADSVVVLALAAGPTRRARAMGYFAAAQAIGISAGPAAGGLLLSGLSWPWVFWVSVPFCIVGGVLELLVVPVAGPTSADRRFDWQGTLLLMPALVALMLTLTELHAWGPTSPALVAAAAAAAAVLIAAFIWWERRAPAPLITMALFRARAFSGGALAVLLSYAMLYGMFFAISFAFVRGYGMTPLQAGLRLAVVPVALGVVAPLGGKAAKDRVRLVKLAGMALCATAAILVDRLFAAGNANRDLAMAILAVYGAGLGLFIAPNNSATLAAAPPDHVGQAGGLIKLMRAFGTGAGIAAASSLLAWRLERSTELESSTLTADWLPLLAASGDVMLMLAGLAALAAIAASLPPGRRRQSQPDRSGTPRCPPDRSGARDPSRQSGQSLIAGDANHGGEQPQRIRASSVVQPADLHLAGKGLGLQGDGFGGTPQGAAPASVAAAPTGNPRKRWNLPPAGAPQRPPPGRRASGHQR